MGWGGAGHLFCSARPDLQAWSSVSSLGTQGQRPPSCRVKVRAGRWPEDPGWPPGTGFSRSEPQLEAATVPVLDAEDLEMVLSELSSHMVLFCLCGPGGAMGGPSGWHLPSVINA